MDGRLLGGNIHKVVKMANWDYSNLKANNDDFQTRNELFENDLLMEQILENINTTPVGKVLKNIASLPEIRQEKVLGIRRQITEGNYDLNGRLDSVIDKVLEDLMA